MRVANDVTTVRQMSHCVTRRYSAEFYVEQRPNSRHFGLALVSESVKAQALTLIDVPDSTDGRNGCKPTT